MPIQVRRTKSVGMDRPACALQRVHGTARPIKSKNCQVVRQKTQTQWFPETEKLKPVCFCSNKKKRSTAYRAIHLQGKE